MIWYVSHAVRFSFLITRTIGILVLLILVAVLCVVIASGTCVLGYAVWGPVAALKARHQFVQYGVPFRTTWRDEMSPSEHDASDEPFLASGRRFFMECGGNVVHSAREDWHRYMQHCRSTRYLTGAA